jgi:hypothetical protein
MTINQKYDAEFEFFQNKRILDFCAQLAQNWSTTPAMVWVLALALSAGPKATGVEHR